jgi:hypothetical protein
MQNIDQFTFLFPFVDFRGILKVHIVPEGLQGAGEFWLISEEY